MMDLGESKRKKSSMIKRLVLSLSFHSGRRSPSAINDISLSKSKSWHCRTAEKSQENECKTRQKIAPQGCFSVYVGPEKQRFVIRAKYANHPLFKMLLEDAELEYGYTSEGPLLLPCDVDLFYKVLAEMDSGKEVYSGDGFPYGSCSPLIQACLVRSGTMSKSYSPYGLLTQPKLLTMNQF